MARTRRPRLSWVRWFWSDFDGGVKQFTSSEIGVYMKLLHLQLDTGEVQAIPSDPGELARIVGDTPTKRLLRKFEPVEVDGEPMLRNVRMADEAWAAIEEVGAKGWRKGVPNVESEPEGDVTSTKGPPNANETSPKPFPLPTPEQTTDNGTDAAPPAPPLEPDPLTPPAEEPPATPEPVVEVVPDPLPGVKLSKAEAAEDETGWHLGKAYADAGDDWEVRFPGSVPPFGRIGKAMRPWIRREAKRRGVPDRVFWIDLGRPAWQNYLAHADPDYCSAQAFVNKPFQTPGDGKQQQAEIKGRVVAQAELAEIQEEQAQLEHEREGFDLEAAEAERDRRLAEMRETARAKREMRGEADGDL